MNKQNVLIVDDEKNIRLTLGQLLSEMNMNPDSAVNGEEALAKMQKTEYSLILLDLKMPGMDGMEVLRRVRTMRPDIKIIIITAHGTIDYAVEAMKLGAVDFIQKPFTPKEIRELITLVLDRDKLNEKKAQDYKTHFEFVKKCINEQHFEAAMIHAQKAISLNPSRPEAFNLLGVLFEIKKNKQEAQKNYRAALSLDPSYKPAIQNLHRITQWTQKGQIEIGEITESGDVKGKKTDVKK
ncbi:response regulator [bacterium]|nr:response regulator [bacterium]RQV98100.1 MAG: response regulator [bacterium]